MTRGHLQGWTLAVWFLGFVASEVVVFTADLNDVDSYTVSRDNIDRFSSTFQADLAEPNLKLLAKRLETLIEDQDVTRRRTRTSFEDYMKGRLFTGEDQVGKDQVVRWLGANCGEDKVKPFYFRNFEIYLPWLTIMLVGLFYENSSNDRIEKGKAAASLGTSGALQLFFVALLCGLFLLGDLHASRNLQPIAAACASVIGALVQFVFPRST